VDIGSYNPVASNDETVNYNALFSHTPFVTGAWSATGLPVGLSIDPDTGVITGIPAGSGTGTFVVTAL
jgi:Putative Ig domain